MPPTVTPTDTMIPSTNTPINTLTITPTYRIFSPSPTPTATVG
jgi:hypothetical protein